MTAPDRPLSEVVAEIQEKYENARGPSLENHAADYLFHILVWDAWPRLVARLKEAERMEKSGSPG